MIDLHTHVLPGIDDGPADLDGSIAIVRAAAERGTREIVATPHVSWHWRNTPETIADSVAGLRARLAELELDVEIYAGAEIAVTRALEIGDDDLRRLGLGGGPWLLIEPPYSAVAMTIESVLFDLQARGHKIILAHVERCIVFSEDIDLLERVVRRGALASVTAGSLAGSFGSSVKRAAIKMVEQGLIHNVASDAHNCGRRPPGLAQELARAGLREQTGWLTEEVPRAILDGSDIPPAPDWPSLGLRSRVPTWLRR